MNKCTTGWRDLILFLKGTGSQLGCFVQCRSPYVLDSLTLLRDFRNAELLLLNSWIVFSRALFSSSILRIRASRLSPFCLSSSLSCAAFWKAHSRGSKYWCAANEWMQIRLYNTMVRLMSSHLCDVVSLRFLLFALRRSHWKGYDLETFFHYVNLV